MKICLHSYYEICDPYIGGTQTLLIKLAKELKILGHEVFIVCSSLNQHYVIEGVDIYGMIPKQYINLLMTKYKGNASSKFLKDAIFNGLDMNSALSRLAEYSFAQYSMFQADVYHLNSYIAAFTYTSTTPIVAYQHENEFEFDGFWGEGAFCALVKYINHINCNNKNTPLLFTASQYYSEKFSNIFNMPITPIHLGVLLNDMTYTGKITYTEELTFNRHSSSIVILVPSRFNVKQKGQDIAIMACEKLLEKGYDLEVVFSGIKSSLLPELEDFRAKYKSLCITKHIHFISVNDMHDLYNSVHVVLSPERYCSYGLSISEALAMGIPTVLSKIPTYIEIASKYEHAKFFPTDNLDELVLQLESTINESSKFGFRFTNAAIEFRINNDIRRTAISFSNVYKELIKQ